MLERLRAQQGGGGGGVMGECNARGCVKKFKSNRVAKQFAMLCALLNDVTDVA